MPNRHRYLVDYPIEPYFQHIALAPWPNPVDGHQHYQLDWVYQIETLESWLEQYVGSHYREWVWATKQEQQSWQACVAFSRAGHKSLFLLQWAR
jgi:hypothetical protein